MKVTQWLAAVMRDDVPVQELDRLRAAGIDAYELVGQLPRGPARSWAWSAHVFQTYADKLMAASPTGRYIHLSAAQIAQELYLLAGSCLDRARQIDALPESVARSEQVPPIPRWRSPIRSQNELVGMRETLDALRTYVAADLRVFEVDESTVESLRRMLALIDARFDVEGLWLKRPPAEIRARIGDLLGDGIDKAYTLGGLLADPDLQRRLAYKLSS